MEVYTTNTTAAQPKTRPFGMDNTPENTHPLETAAAAELRRFHAERERDEALLRQALEALDSDNPDIQLRTAIAVRQRLGEQSLRTDAERYRWLRDKADSITVCACTDDGEWIPLHPDNIDATIDAAMKADRD